MSFIHHRTIWKTFLTFMMTTYYIKLYLVISLIFISDNIVLLHMYLVSSELLLGLLAVFYKPKQGRSVVTKKIAKI